MYEGISIPCFSTKWWHKFVFNCAHSQAFQTLVIIAKPAEHFQALVPGSAVKSEFDLALHTKQVVYKRLNSLSTDDQLRKLRNYSICEVLFPTIDLHPNIIIAIHLKFAFYHRRYRKPRKISMLKAHACYVVNSHKKTLRDISKQVQLPSLR